MTAAVEQLKIEIPFNKEHTVIQGGRIAFLWVGHDEHASNPLTDCDAMGSIWSFGRRHSNFKNPDEIFKDPSAPTESPFLRDYRDSVLLSYFEHGNCIWGVRGTLSDTPDFRWDGVSIAGIWTPDECLRKELKTVKPQDRYAKLREWASQACEAYTAWCNGEVYAYGVRGYELRKDQDGTPWEESTDYRRSEALVEESCCGFVGHSSMKYMLGDCMAPIVKDALLLEEAPELSVT